MQALGGRSSQRCLLSIPVSLTCGFINHLHCALRNKIFRAFMTCRSTLAATNAICCLLPLGKCLAPSSACFSFAPEGAPPAGGFLAAFRHSANSWGVRRKSMLGHCTHSQRLLQCTTAISCPTLAIGRHHHAHLINLSMFLLAIHHYKRIPTTVVYLYTVVRHTCWQLCAYRCNVNFVGNFRGLLPRMAYVPLFALAFPCLERCQAGRLHSPDV